MSAIECQTVAGNPRAMDQSAVPARPLSLRRNFSWTLAGNIVDAGCQWGMLITLAKLGTPTLVGQFVLAFAVTAPFIMFANLQLRTVQATDARNEYQFGDYFALRLVTTSLAMLVIAIVALGFYELELAGTIVVVGIAKSFESISDVVYGLLQKYERMDQIAKLQMIRGPISLGGVGLTLWLTGSLLLAVTVLAIVWGVRLLLWDLPCALWVSAGREDLSNVRPRWDGQRLTRLAWLALPLGITGWLVSLNSSIPRYVIAYYLDLRLLGIFAAIAYLNVIGGRVIVALGQAATPRLAQYFAQGNFTAFRKLLTKLVFVGATVGILGIAVAAVAGPHVLAMLYTEEYSEYTDMFILLMAAGGVSYVATFAGYGVTATRMLRSQAIVALALVMVCTIAAVLLIPQYGVLGAALALLAAFTVQASGYLLCNYIATQ